MLSRKLAVFGSIAALSVAAAPIAGAATATAHGGSHHTHRVDRSRDRRSGRDRLHDHARDRRSVDPRRDL